MIMIRCSAEPQPERVTTGLAPASTRPARITPRRDDVHVTKRSEGRFLSEEPADVRGEAKEGPGTPLRAFTSED